MYMYSASQEKRPTRRHAAVISSSHPLLPAIRILHCPRVLAPSLAVFNQHLPPLPLNGPPYTPTLPQSPHQPHLPPICPQVISSALQYHGKEVMRCIIYRQTECGPQPPSPVARYHRLQRIEQHLHRGDAHDDAEIRNRVVLFVRRRRGGRGRQGRGHQ